MQKKSYIFIARALITAAVFLCATLPFRPSDASEILWQRPIAFIPIVLGIFWGAPAAIGIFLADLAHIAIYAPSGALIPGIALMNTLSAIGARYLFYLPVGHSMAKGQYIHDFWTLLKFITSVLITESILSAAVSASLSISTGSDFGPVFSTILFNNIHSTYIFGIPVMLFLPLLHRWADEPACTVRKEEALYGFSSANSVTFRKVMMLSILIASAECAVLLFKYKTGTSAIADSINDMLKFFTLTDVMTLLFSAFVIFLVQRELVDPLRSLASRLTIEGETYSDEFDIISRSMDFVVSGAADLISGTEYSILIGLTAKDCSKQFSVREAKEIINGICLNHVKGYISTVDGEGGYRGEDSAGSEQVLIYTVYGATETQIHGISDDILDRLNQESVLIEKNRSLRYYYYGKRENSYLCG